MTGTPQSLQSQWFVDGHRVTAVDTYTARLFGISLHQVQGLVVRPWTDEDEARAAAEAEDTDIDEDDEEDFDGIDDTLPGEVYELAEMIHSQSGDYLVALDDLAALAADGFYARLGILPESAPKTD